MKKANRKPEIEFVNVGLNQDKDLIGVHLTGPYEQRDLDTAIERARSQGFETIFIHRPEIVKTVWTQTMGVIHLVKGGKY